MTELEYLKKYLHPEDNLEEAIKRLNNGEPLQYIVGDTEFYGSIFKVNKNVLIPRPETEELVEKALNLIPKVFNEKNLNILDIGTGSGCIPITLKKHLPDAELNAVDISRAALEVAKENAKLNNTNVNFIESNIFSNVNDTFDIIISNPPYIREDEPIMDIVKNNEPHLALYAKDNGLYFYETITREACNFLNNKFIIAYEIGEEQGESVVSIAKKYFPDAKIILEQDLRHFDRFVFIIRR